MAIHESVYSSCKYIHTFRPTGVADGIIDIFDIRGKILTGEPAMEVGEIPKMKDNGKALEIVDSVSAENLADYLKKISNQEPSITTLEKVTDKERAQLDSEATWVEKALHQL